MIGSTSAGDILVGAGASSPVTRVAASMSALSCFSRTTGSITDLERDLVPLVFTPDRAFDTV
jgi:hypothetical protein